MRETGRKSSRYSDCRIVVYKASYIYADEDNNRTSLKTKRKASNGQMGNRGMESTCMVVSKLPIEEVEMKQ